MYQIRVTSKFSAAHNLRNYGGKCENLHGHTWKVEACIQGEELNSIGILTDFKEVKMALGETLAKYDHAYINELTPFDKTNPTAENLAYKIYYDLKKQFPNLSEVSVWESEDSRAVFRETK
jgi:6-pyruvoyltetrahydropterin/6-carboxytetrahydropterin synthase